METLQSEDRKTIKNPVIGDFVKVLSPSFKDFYRAEIKNIINTDFHVSYIDYGNTEVVQLSDIFELSNELKKENKLPIKVSIEVPINAKVNDEIEMLFTNLIDNNVVLSIEFNEINTNGLKNVILKEVESGNKVNDNVLKILPIQKPKIKNADSCYLRHFENFDSIYVSKVEDSQILVDTVQSTDRKTKTNPAIGDIIKVLSPSFDGFFRAEIIKILENTKYLVFYIDFGNTEIIESNNIFELSDNLYNKPGTAIKIGINVPHNVVPNDEIKEMFSELADNEELIIIAFDESSEIGLTNCILKIKSSDILINNKVTELLSERSSILDKTNDCEIKNEEHLKSPDVKSNQIKPKLLKNGEVVFYRYFHNSNSVFVGQGSEEHQQQFLTVTEETMNDLSKINKSNIEIGDVVKAEFDGIMYRAKILKKVNEDRYCISFIDFGNQETVHVNEIFELSDDLNQIPDLCIEIGIKGLPIIDETKKKMIMGSLEELELKPLYIEYDENIPNGLQEATLRYKSNNLSVFDDIFKNNNILNIKGSLEKLPIITEPTEKEVVLNNSIGPEIMSSNAPDELNHSKSNGSNVYSKNIKSGDYVEFLFGNNIDNIFVRHSKVYQDFKHILEQLKVEKTNNLVSINPKPNDYVVVYSRKYNGCYRAKVFGPSDDDTTKFKCSLIDFGYIDFIPSKNIFELPNNYTRSKIPINLVYRVTLSGLTKITNNNKLIPHLKSLTGKQYVLEFDKNADRWYKQVVLKDINSEKTLNQEIQELITNISPPISQQKRLEIKTLNQEIQELTTNISQPLSQQTRSERKIILPAKVENELKKPSHPIKSGTPVFITHFENFDSIFVRDASYDFIEKFNDFNRRMLKHFRKSRAKEINTKEINIGDKVCVKSIINMVMYSRALVIDKIGENFEVFYVDYGNKELVNIDDILELPNELEKLPDFVMKIQLKNMTPLPTDHETQSIREYFKKTFTLLNTKLIVEFNEFNINGLEHVILKTEFYEEDICDKLRDMVKVPPLNTKNTGPQQNSDLNSRPKFPYILRRQNSMII